MIKIIKFAKKSWHIMIMILLMLFIQAYCDLALPEYTSKIVDVGIQNGGIESNVPQIIRDSEYQRMQLLSEDSVKELIRNSYIRLSEDNLSESEYRKFLSQYPQLAKENLYLLKEDADVELLSEKLMPAQLVLLILSATEGEQAALKDQMLVKMGMAELTGSDTDTILAALPQEYLSALGQEMYTAVSKEYSTMLDRMGIAYVTAEYKAVGVDLVKVQNSFFVSNGGMMLGIAFVGMIIAAMAGFLASKLAAGTSMDIRKKIFRKVVSFSNGEMDQFSTASLITRSTNDIQQVQMVLVMIFRLVAFAPIMGIGGIIQVLKTSVSMSWIIAIAVLAIGCLVVVLMSVAMPKFKKMQILVDKVNLVTREILTGIPVVRAFSREKHEEERFDGASRELMRTQLFTNRAMAIMNPFMMLIMNGITVLIIWVGAHGIDNGTLQVGQMMAFITYTMQVVMSFLMITMVSIMLPRATVAATRIEEVLESKTMIKDPENPKLLSEHAKGEVEFHHVNFMYPGAEEDALADISFTAKPGETTAIIGSTGCGKSTLVNLIPRLYDVTEGSVTIDGVDIRELTQKDLRSRIGFVPQKGVLFSGDIASNLRFGKEDATEAEISKAAEIAQASEFIESKPERFASSIAQGGANVSGGQKQRLAIARAIAKTPDIYVFDDSFSALDYKTDIALRKALKDQTAESTVIIVAQRISTIIHAEKIIVLDEGKIAGMGTHSELLKTSEIYRQIAASQLSAEEMDQDNGKEDK